MEGTAPPAPAGSVPSSERLRHGPNPSPLAADAVVRSEVADALADGTVTEVAVTGIPDVAGADTCKQLPPRDSVSGRVLVLNATYEPINVCSIRRAVVLLLKEKAEMLERNARELHSERYTVARPVVIRLVSYVRVPRQAHRRKITRRAVFARDGWACQYCGSRSNLTVDHVIPRSKGGQSSWENIVASCGPCNRRKGDSLLAQAGMELRHAPRTPRAEIFIHVSAPTIPTAWQPYLAQAA
jgi:5-methylcytosine-specific restriction endonuclease McrA